MALTRGISGRKISFTAKQKHSISGISKTLKCHEIPLIFLLRYKLPVASAGKNRIACPCGRQLLCKQIFVLGWHRFTALWFFSVHPINQAVGIGRWIYFPTSWVPDNRHPASYFGVCCYKVALPSNWRTVENVHVHREMKIPW